MLPGSHPIYDPNDGEGIKRMQHIHMRLMENQIPIPKPEMKAEEKPASIESKTTPDDDKPEPQRISYASIRHVTPISEIASAFLDEKNVTDPSQFMDISRLIPCLTYFQFIRREQDDFNQFIQSRYPFYPDEVKAESLSGRDCVLLAIATMINTPDRLGWPLVLQAFPYLNEAVKKRDPFAHYILGKLYRNAAYGSFGLGRNLTSKEREGKAEHHFHVAAADGVLAAIVQITRLTPKTLKQYEHLAERGCLEAMHALGDEIAPIWLEKAFKSGYKKSAMSLADHYQSQQDLENAIVYYRLTYDREFDNQSLEDTLTNWIAEKKHEKSEKVCYHIALALSRSVMGLEAYTTLMNIMKNKPELFNQLRVEAGDSWEDIRKLFKQHKEGRKAIKELAFVSRALNSTPFDDPTSSLIAEYVCGIGPGLVSAVIIKERRDAAVLRQEQREKAEADAQQEMVSMRKLLPFREMFFGLDPANHAQLGSMRLDIELAKKKIISCSFAMKEIKKRMGRK